MDLDAFDAFDDGTDDAPPPPAPKRGPPSAVNVEPPAPAKKPRPSDVPPAAAPAKASTSLAASSDDAAAAPKEGDDYVDWSGKACKHEVAMPPGVAPDASMISLDVPEGRTPARSYKFELDPFQAAAVACIERDESVLVSAHTSAGKTVCAEYAIATSLRETQRVLYTSPIKALSNQKYRELKEEFGDVGLMTGDVTIDVDSSCLVMTTESIATQSGLKPEE